MPPRCTLVLGLAALVMAPALRAQPAFEPLPTTLPDRRGHFAVAPADYDGDGDFDLLTIRTDANFLEQTELTPVLYRNDGVDADGVLQFVEVPFPAPSYPTQQLGWDPMGEALAWADYDNDGDVDAIVATPYGSALYRNDDGVFTEVAEFPRYSEGYASVFDARSIVWADVDNDGDVDLLLPESIEPDDPSVPDSAAVVLYRNDGGAFTPTADDFPYTRTGLHLSVGDVDGDGDNDLLYHDVGWNCSPYDGQPEEEECLYLFDNEDGTLLPLPIDFPTVRNRGSSGLADIDNDGDLDVLIASGFVDDDTGETEVGVRLYRNDGGTFTPESLDLDPGDGQEYGEVFAATFADYDNDGDVDVLVSGRTAPPEVEGIAYVFANDGDGAFTRVEEFPAAQYGPGAIAWADFDNDGALDYLATGRGFDPDTAFVYTSWLYRNATLDENNPPSAPEGPSASTSGNRVTLSWGPAADDHTPTQALTYNLWVRTTEGSDTVSPLARPGGGRFLAEPGNVSLNRSWTLRNLPEGTYEWGVQAIDNAFNGGPFAAGGTFTIGTAVLALAIAPVGSPVVVPAEGGAFDFTVTVTNVSGAPQTFRGWTQATLPNGNERGPLFEPVRITLAPGETLGPVTLRQSVPAAAPAGTYSYRASVGGGPGAVVASRAFTFEKPAEAAGTDGDGEAVADWHVEQIAGPPLAESAGSTVPATFALGGAYPNPAPGGEAFVRVDLPERASVTVRLYDVLGRLVLSSAPEALEAGAGRTLALDVSALPAGVYVYRVEAALAEGVEEGSGRLTVVH